LPLDDEAKALLNSFRGHQIAHPSTGVLKEMRVIGDFIFLVLFFVLLAVWLVGWFAFHVAGGAIHLLLLVAVISLVIHLFRGRTAA
jgi:Family of unknown function (DUF5670)